MSKKINTTQYHNIYSKLVNAASRSVEEATRRYTTSIKAFPLVEAFMRRIPNFIWDNIDPDRCYVSDTSVSVFLPHNMALYNKMAKAMREAGFVQTNEWDPSKNGSKSTYHQFRWHLEDARNWNDPSIEITLDSSSAGSTCVMVPLEIVKKTVEQVTAYERICPEGHPELFDENGNYIGQPMVVKVIDETKPKETE